MKTIATILLMGLLSVLFTGNCLAQKYSITDLGPLNPKSINTWGQIVGDYNNHAYVWAISGGMKDLGTIPGGTFSTAAAINDLGVVVGTANGPGTVVSHDSNYGNKQCSDLQQPFIWTQRSGMKGLGTFGNVFWYEPVWCFIPFTSTAINTAGQVVGYTGAISTFQWGFRWTHDDGMSWFGGSWPPTFAHGISNTGQIVGQNNVFTSFTMGHAASWKDDLITDLGSLGGEDLDYSSSANGINDRGQIVGWSTLTPVSRYSGGFPVHAVLWTTDSVIHDLGTLPDDESSAAYKISFFGDVIGASGNTLYAPPDLMGASTPFEVIGRPFIWSERDGMRDLNSLIKKHSGWVLNSANDINIWGQIVGSGTLNGEGHGFLLTPNKLLKQ